MPFPFSSHRSMAQAAYNGGRGLDAAPDDGAGRLEHLEQSMISLGPHADLFARHGAADIRRAIIAQRCEQDLLSFARAFWHVCDPEEPFINGWPVEAIADHLMAVTDGHIKRLCINVPPGFSKSLFTDVFWPAWEWGPMKMPWMRYIAAAYTSSLTQRDNGRCLRIIMDADYQANWSDQFGMVKIGAKKIENDRTGWKLATSVEGVGTGERGNRIIIDDPNNPRDVESDIVREGTNLWLREVMPDRLNNMKERVIVVIQQRTHEHDASGTLLDVMGRDYVHLCVPMEYEPSRHCVTAIGWEDPRGLDKNNKRLPGFVTDENGELTGDVIEDSPAAQQAGRLAWSARFPRDVCDNLRQVKGAYSWCTPGETPILMADLSLKPIAEICEGDEIIGFTDDAEARLVRSRVLSISRSLQTVYRYTLDSGEVIRATRDHRWYLKRYASHRAFYAQAEVGSLLLRVCPSSLPQPTSEDRRLLGWLAGFFDADGSALTSPREVGSKCQIVFSQGMGRNQLICTKLEDTLRHFDFDYGYYDSERSDRRPSTEQASALTRHYFLRGRSMPLLQRFLHLVGPTKWRDRIADGALGSDFVLGNERVLSIEEDGAETVYGLETTSTNYIAWGLTSKNSGQYNQLPVPRGGGLIQRQWWQLWRNERFPDFGSIIASLDTAIKEEEENDWNALTVWGAFPDEDEAPLLMLRMAWRMRGSLGELAHKAGETCKQLGVDTLLIEDKTRGHDTAAEIRRLFGAANFTTVLVPPAGDKVSRVIACQPLWSGDALSLDAKTGIAVWGGGVIYAPGTEWAEEVIDECAKFPRAEHDDYVDSATQALLWMRRNGVVLRKVEFAAEEFERRKFESIKRLTNDTLADRYNV
jgi:predicted phage terminase large subunit-like protein